MEQGKCFPLVYVFMTHKHQQLYEEVFEEIKGHFGDNDIEADYIITDFEKAAINAIGTVFGNHRSAGCYFHLRKSIIAKIKEVGLITTYSKLR